MGVCTSRDDREDNGPKSVKGRSGSVGSQGGIGDEDIFQRFYCTCAAMTSRKDGNAQQGGSRVPRLNIEQENQYPQQEDPAVIGSSQTPQGQNSQNNSPTSTAKPDSDVADIRTPDSTVPDICTPSSTTSGNYDNSLDDLIEDLSAIQDMSPLRGAHIPTFWPCSGLAGNRFSEASFVARAGEPSSLEELEAQYVEAIVALLMEAEALLHEAAHLKLDGYGDEDGLEHLQRDEDGHHLQLVAV